VGPCTLIRFHWKFFDLPHAPVTVDAARVPENLWNDCTALFLNALISGCRLCEGMGRVTIHGCGPLMLPVNALIHLLIRERRCVSLLSQGSTRNFPAVGLESA